MVQMAPLSSTHSNVGNPAISVGNSPIRSSASGTGRVTPLAPLDESCLSARQKKILGIALVIVGVVTALFCPLLVMAYGAIGFAALGGIGIALAGMWIWYKSSHTSTPSNELSRNEPSQLSHIAFARTQTVAAATHLEAAATLSAPPSSLVALQMPAAIEEESNDDFFSRLLIDFAKPELVTDEQMTHWLHKMSKGGNLFERWDQFVHRIACGEDNDNSPLFRAIFCLLDHMHDNPESIKDYLPCLPFFMFLLSHWATIQDDISKEMLINQNVFLEDKHLLTLNTVSEALMIYYPQASLFAVARGALFPFNYNDDDNGIYDGNDINACKGFISIYHRMRPEAKRLNSEILARLIAKPGPAMPRDLASIVTSYLSPPPYDFIRLVMAQMYNTIFQDVDIFQPMNFQEHQYEYLAQIIHSGDNDPKFIKAVSDPFAQRSGYRTNILETLCRASDFPDPSRSTRFKVLIPFINSVVMPGCERERRGLKQQDSPSSVIYPLLNEEMSNKCQKFLEGLQGEVFFNGFDLNGINSKFFEHIKTLFIEQIPAGYVNALYIRQIREVAPFRINTGTFNVKPGSFEYYYRDLFDDIESILFDYYYLMFLRFKINFHTQNQIPNEIPNLNPTPAPNITPAVSLVGD